MLATLNGESVNDLPSCGGGGKCVLGLYHLCWWCAPVVASTFVAALTLSSAWVGASAATIASWSWVDGTSSSNLNCGATSGCDLWISGEPQYVWLVGGKDRDYS